ncbi:TPA: hypothetical protein QDC27_004562 [Burkholderia cepacia ATCC 25416]|uniref:hypothetical protein n=1 Tax=Burkholderia cepacia TaxID=292 RepID=UPI000A82FCCD|nr:hypothetical protein [Burkholderia cepacia]HDR9769914.1 hypothetical protein [Burkholderia cepacia ATCC 25416]MBE2968900.1 hypothetical protein [Burkholderia cepacia]MCA8075530.1 hypothetical protein [Burkholderia cepacia]MCA8323333.1 hypothetical protein [Burkholderia cepacia]MDW9227278.1 hypothetical protein [Burkholderia cepacia]
MQNGRLPTVRPAESASTDTAAPAAGVFPDRLFIARFTADIGCLPIFIRFDSAPVSRDE